MIAAKPGVAKPLCFRNCKTTTVAESGAAKPLVLLSQELQNHYFFRVTSEALTICPHFVTIASARSYRGRRIDHIRLRRFHHTRICACLACFP